MTCTAYAGVMPSYVRGSVVRLTEDGQAELEHLPDPGIPEQSIDHASDEELRGVSVRPEQFSPSQWTEG